MEVRAGTSHLAHEDVSAPRPVAPFVVAWMALASAYLLLSVYPHGGSLEIVRQLAYLLPFWAATVVSAQVSFNADPHERMLLRALAVAIALVAASETLVSVRVLIGGGLEGGWPLAAEVLTISAAALMVGALARQADLRAYTPLTRIRHGIDAAGVSIAAATVVLAGIVVPLTDGSEVTASQGVAAAVYSGFGILLLIVTAANFGIDPGSSPHPWFRRVLAGFLLYGLATAFWPAWLYGTVIRPESVTDVLVELAWMSGMSLAFAGMVSRMSAGVRPSEAALPKPRTMPHAHVAMSAAVPIVLTAAAAAALAFGARASMPDSYGSALLVLGSVLAAMVVARQIFAAVENQRLLRALVTDPVTGMHAYRSFQDALQAEVDIAQRSGGTCALVMFDIDGFRSLNDSHGHAAGDSALKQAADAIARSIRSSDVVGRLGGDEFAVVMGGASLEHAERVVMRSLTEIRGLCDESGAHMQATAGVALYPLHAGTRAELMRCAAGALFWAKRHDRGGFAVYDPRVVTALDAKDEIEQLETETQVRAIRALAVAVDARDAATQYHSKNVALLATELACELGMPREHVRRLEIAALLHDVGKIGVSDRVLRKRSPLAPAEIVHVREHAVLGERILRSSGFDDVAPWVRHHHERYDGTGYPDGLSGDQIPLEARVLAICDAYDAMTSERPYRSAMSPAAALHEIDCCIGTQFDPEVAEAFIALMGRRLSG
ncbi:MAG: diguanylate cyclase [Coriobacteriia bacterium]|nr:diguanylate cyclase [Coriobacteriia bacterium]